MRLKANAYTLIELAVCIGILGIISVGAASLLQSSIQSEMISRSQQQQQSIAMSLFALLQSDLSSAQNIAITSNQLSFQHATNKQNVSYTYGNNQIVRNDNGLAQTFPDPQRLDTFSISCDTPCFQSTGAPITKISLNHFSIQDSRFATNKIGLTYPIEQATFSVVNGNEFF